MKVGKESRRHEGHLREDDENESIEGTVLSHRARHDHEKRLRSPVGTKEEEFDYHMHEKRERGKKNRIVRSDLGNVYFGEK